MWGGRLPIASLGDRTHELLRHKVLSSSVTKGRVTACAGGGQIVDPQRRKDPPGFWVGYRLCLVGSQGELLAETTVSQFDVQAGLLVVDPDVESVVKVGQTYEIRSPEEAPLLAIRYLMGLSLGQPVPKVMVRLGTTRGTNALITRRAPKRHLSPREDSETFCGSGTRTVRASSTWPSGNPSRSWPRYWKWISG